MGNETVAEEGIGVQGGEHLLVIEREEIKWEDIVGDIVEREKEKERGQADLKHETREVNQTDLRLTNGLPWECWASCDRDMHCAFQPILPDITAVSFAGGL